MASRLVRASLDRAVWVLAVGTLCHVTLLSQGFSSPRCIQLHKSVKTYATMPIGIMGRKSLALID